MAEQDLEHYIRDELPNVAAHFTDLDLGRMEAWVKLFAWSGVELLNCMNEDAL